MPPYLEKAGNVRNYLNTLYPKARSLVDGKDHYNSGLDRKAFSEAPTRSWVLHQHSQSTVPAPTVTPKIVLTA